MKDYLKPVVEEVIFAAEEVTFTGTSEGEEIEED